jgi:metallo-beta-lactamase class B
VRRRTIRELLAFAFGLAAILIVVLGWLWKSAVDSNGQGSADPFRLAGNLYYVGGSSVSIFLVTGPEGHILLDGGYPADAPMIIASIARLGFDIKDVKVLLNSIPHRDRAGALAALQRASGAELWASESSARTLATGGDDPDTFLPLRALVQVGLLSYPAAHVHRRFNDGDTIRVGPVALTAHVTGGATRGCTSYSFPVRDGDRVLNVVSVCPLGIMPAMQYPERQADLERSLRVLRSLPADIWVTSTSRSWRRYDKFVASQAAKDPVEPFIDPEGYRAYLDAAEAELRQGTTR